MADQIFKSIFTHLLGTCPTTPHLVGAFIDSATGLTISRGELRSFALQLADSLQAPPKPLRALLNAAKHTPPTVLIFSPNSIVWPILLFGAAAAGFRATLANSAYTPNELKYQYLDSGAQLIFVHPSLFGVVRDMLTSIGHSESDIRATVVLATSAWLTSVPDSDISQDFSGLTRLEDLLRRGELASEVNFDGERSNETFCLCYSSGTTGKPKGVETTHYNLTPGVFFGSLPYYHIYGAVKLLLLSVALCCSDSRRSPGFDPDKFLEAIVKYRATYVLVVPPILVVFARHQAAPLSPDLVTIVRKRFQSAGSSAIITQAYGLTETSPTVFLLPVEYANDRVGSVRLVREDAGEVLTDIEGAGELWVRGPIVMKPAITPDGWLKTGDIAVRDSGGFFAIVDRRKELIKYKVPVTGVHSEEEATELPRAYVVPASSCHRERRPCPFALGVQDWVAVRVAPHKKLRGGIVLVPTNSEEVHSDPVASGKILRR
ncbi:AMP binding protein [Pisolithus microcarpus]|nr:AMP binding protein [Pisolithus microcarpus]